MAVEPQVILTSPADASVDIALAPTIGVLYDQSVDPASVGSDQIMMVHMATQSVVAITGITVSNRQISFQPAASLEPNAVYTVIVRNGVRSVLGVSPLHPFVFSFSTADTDLTAPTLLGPDDQSTVYTTPIFSWEAVSGADHYEIQVATNPTFSDIYWPEGVYDPTGTEVSPDTTFEVGIYFWRVRAIGPDATPIDGPWSTTRTFTLSLTSFPPTYETYDSDAEVLAVSDSDPEYKASNQAVSSWTVTFTQELGIDLEAATPDDAADYIIVWAVPVSGGPEAMVAGTWSQPESDEATPQPDAKKLTFTPTDGFADNTLYKMVIRATLFSTTGDTIGQRTELWFTSTYDPLYTNSQLLRDDLGALVEDEDEDLINRFIHRASIDANASYYGLPMGLNIWPAGGYTMSQLAQGPWESNAFYYVVGYVRASAEISLLERARRRHLERAGQQRMLADLRLGESAETVLNDIKHDIEELRAAKREYGTVIGSYVQGHSAPGWTQRSADWIPRIWASTDQVRKTLAWYTY